MNCSVEPDETNTDLGFQSAVPKWEAIATISILSLVIVVTIIGNLLVIASVFTYTPLRIVQNFFIVSLAIADLTVAILVMPFNVAYTILGHWVFGSVICKLWLTSDVLCCTASILNLCAIALDRFWAITDPINYAQKRTVKRVLLMIAGVWILSLLISSPPLVGWNDWPNSAEFTVCKLTERQGYVVYSSLGSFFIPLFIMTIVYVEIFVATKRRLRERAQAAKLNTMYTNKIVAHDKFDEQNVSDKSETSHDKMNESDTDQEEKTCNKGKDTAPSKNSDKERNNSNAPFERSLHHNSSISLKSLKQFKTRNTNTTDTIVKKSTVYLLIEEKQRISLSKERRAAKILGIIMGVFVICWLPFFLMYVIKPFCLSCCPSKRLINFITWLGYINSVLNPIIYTIFNLDFRQAFSKLLTIKSCTK